MNKAEEEKMLFGHFLTVNDAVPMTSIIWSNIKYSKCNRATRTIIIWIIAILIVLLAFYGMVRFKDFGDSLVASAPTVKCPKKPIDLDTAYIDSIKVPKQRQGLLHCYCLKAYNENGGDITSTYADFLKKDPNLVESPCVEWKFAFVYNFYLVIIAGAMIGILNSICVAIFEIIVIFEKCQTYMEFTKAQFERIFIVQYLNIALVLIFADFSLGYAESELGLPILVGKHKDFDTAWFYDVGAKISFAMVTNSVSSFFGRLAHPLISIALRYYERDFNTHLRKYNNYIKAKQEEQEAERRRRRFSLGGRKEEPKEDKKEEEDMEGGTSLAKRKARGASYEGGNPNEVELVEP